MRSTNNCPSVKNKISLIVKDINLNIDNKVGENQMSIDWNFPEPREGLAGAWDKFVGPGANRIEIILALTVAVLAGISIPIIAIYSGLGWNNLQIVVAALFAFDLFGGVVTNATSAAKRWYHREGQGFKEHLIFNAVHIHPFIIALLFSGFGWESALLIYGYLIISAVILLKSPLYLERPLALTFYSGAIFMGVYLIQMPAGWEWFIPLYFLKLLVAHLLREEPYRPN